MQRKLICDCGFVIESLDRDELIAVARFHARTTHGVDLSRVDVLQILRRRSGPFPEEHGR